MSKVAVVTDSVAQIPDKIATSLEIRVVPSIIQIDGDEYLDGVNIDAQSLYQRMRSEELTIRTTSPPLGFFYNEFKLTINRGYDSIVYIGLTSQLSATFSTAEAAAMAFRQEFPRTRIELVDSRTATIAQGFVAIEAAQLARKGASIETILARVRVVRERVGLVAALETLKYLARGGRIGKVAYMMGSLIKIIPIVTINRNGTVAPIGRIRGEHRVLENLVDFVEQVVAGYRTLKLAIMHADASERAAELEQLARERFNLSEILCTDFTPVMGAHAGPGVIGLAYYYE